MPLRRGNLQKNNYGRSLFFFSSMSVKSSAKVFFVTAVKFLNVCVFFLSNVDHVDTVFRLAENRSRRDMRPTLEKIPSFCTNLRAEDMDDSITKYLDTKTCNEEFSRQRSMEDLLVI